MGTVLCLTEQSPLCWSSLCLPDLPLGFPLYRYLQFWMLCYCFVFLYTLSKYVPPNMLFDLVFELFYKWNYILCIFLLLLLFDIMWDSSMLTWIAAIHFHFYLICTVVIYYNLSILLLDEHLCCFQSFATTNCFTVNILLVISWWAYEKVSPKYIPRRKSC